MKRGLELIMISGPIRGLRKLHPMVQTNRHTSRHLDSIFYVFVGPKTKVKDMTKLTIGMGSPKLSRIASYGLQICQFLTISCFSCCCFFALKK